MKFKALIATTSPDQAGEVLTQEALEKMKEMLKSGVLSYEFTHRLPGRTTGARLTDRGLEVFGVIDLPPSAFGEVGRKHSLFMVPGYYKDEQGGLELREITITASPADPTLSPIKWEE